jgi:DNA replication licensing factor MCM7
VQYKDADEEFLQQVTENTRRYIGIFAEALDELMPEPTEAYAVDEDRGILMTQRVDEGVDDEGVDGGADGTDPLQRMPPEIK